MTGAVTSETEICNLALTSIGSSMISSLDEGTKAADLCTLHYPRCRRALLRAHPWNFAIARVTLALSATTPNHEFGYQHALPADCLKVIRTGWEADGTIGPAIYGFPGIHGYAADRVPYRIEGRYLLANEDVARIEYVRDVTDVAQFDDIFVTVLAARIAAEICMALTDNATATKNALDAYRDRLVEARMVDAQEGTPRDIVETSGWLVARG